MKAYGYTVGYTYDENSHSVTVFVNESDTEKRVHDLTVYDVLNRLSAYLRYIEYYEYLIDEGEYWFLDAIGVLGPVVNSYVLPVPEKRKTQ